MNFNLKGEPDKWDRSMETENFNYTVNIDPEDLVNIYVKQWVLEWCKKYHPEAFKEAEKFVREVMNQNE